jgi:MoxR-like ATPase
VKATEEVAQLRRELAAARAEVTALRAASWLDGRDAVAQENVGTLFEQEAALRGQDDVLWEAGRDAALDVIAASRAQLVLRPDVAPKVVTFAIEQMDDVADRIRALRRGAQ